MKLVTNILVLSLLSAGVCYAKDDRWFRSQARVIKLEPVTRMVREALPQTHCQQPVHPVANSMVQDIRQQEDKMARQRACNGRNRTAHRTVGYWVTYEYNGYQGRKYMSEKPGRWIPVTVSLEPLRAASNH